jgi:hypothetical protein
MSSHGLGITIIILMHQSKMPFLWLVCFIPIENKNRVFLEGDMPLSEASFPIPSFR